MKMKFYPIIESTYGINRYVVKPTQFVFFFEGLNHCHFVHHKERVFGLIINKKYPKQLICLN